MGAEGVNQFVEALFVFDAVGFGKVIQRRAKLSV